MALIEQIQKEIAEAMKAKDALRLSVLRGLTRISHNPNARRAN